MSDPFQKHGYLCQAAVAAGLIVKHGTADGTCALATAATDALLGAANAAPGEDKAINEMADVYVGIFGEVRAGGVITRGDRLTANAASKAIATTTQGNVYFGIAEESGVADDVIKYRVALGVV